ADNHGGQQRADNPDRNDWLVRGRRQDGKRRRNLLADGRLDRTRDRKLDPRLVTFQFYGCGEVTMEGERIPLPPDFCGRVTFAVHATSSTGAQHDGLL